MADADGTLHARHIVRGHRAGHRNTSSQATTRLDSLMTWLAVEHVAV